jgi:hypothetical protein
MWGISCCPVQKPTMPESILENNHPLNQKALQMLFQLKQKMDPSKLYILQLCKWALDNAKIRYKENQDIMENRLKLISSLTPEQAMIMLTAVLRESKDRIIFDLNQKPERLAAEVLAYINVLLSAISKLRDKC